MPLFTVTLDFLVSNSADADEVYESISNQLWDVEQSHNALADSGADANTFTGLLHFTISAKAEDFVSASKLGQDAILRAIELAGYTTDLTATESAPILKLQAQSAGLADHMQIA